jgi:putative transposase
LSKLVRRITHSRLESPDAPWVAQQARNVAWELGELGIKAKFLIHDNDAKFGGGSDLVMEGEGLTVIRTPIRAPLANSHIERQNGSTRRECLDWNLIVSRRHLEIVLSEWFEHYNEERPHRALTMKTPIARSDPLEPARTVACRSRLGGLLRGYSATPAIVVA